MWKEKNTSNTWKKKKSKYNYSKNDRLSGWQLQTFLSSYESKKKKINLKIIFHRFHITQMKFKGFIRKSDLLQKKK